MAIIAPIPWSADGATVLDADGDIIAHVITPGIAQQIVETVNACQGGICLLDDEETSTQVRCPCHTGCQSLDTRD